MSFTKTALLFLYIFSLFFTGSFTIQRGMGEGISAASFQYHHLIFIFLLLYQIFIRKDDKDNARIIIPSFWFLLFAIYSLLGFLCFVPRFGIHATVLNFIYAVSVVILFFSVYRNDDLDAVSNVIGYAFLCAMVIIIIKDIMQAQTLIAYFAGGGGDHPGIESYTGGGLNLEATFLGMFCVFVMRKKYGLFVWFISLIISCLYSSRTAFVVNIGALAWYMVFVKRAFSHISLKVLLIILPVTVATIYFVMTSPLGQVMINRFVKTGDEAGSLGRLKMWVLVGTVIEKYPFGVGVGNGITAVKAETTAHIAEGNVHNIFLQYAMEQGVIIGSVFLILGGWWIFAHGLKKHFADPFGVFMLLYLVQGALQSRGVDAHAAVILGLYFVVRRKPQISGKNNSPR